MAVDPERVHAFTESFSLGRAAGAYLPRCIALGIEALDAYDYEQAAQGHDVIGWFPTSMEILDGK